MPKPTKWFIPFTTGNLILFLKITILKITYHQLGHLLDKRIIQQSYNVWLIMFEKPMSHDSMKLTRPKYINSID